MEYEWPQPLAPGAVVGVVSPAGPIDGASLVRGIAALRELGYGVKLGPHLRRRWHYLAGSDEARAQDLQSLWQDRAVSGIWCSRGGYGTMRLFRRLVPTDFARPLPLIGYSDITALQMWLLRERGLISYSGPMVASGYGFGARQPLDGATVNALCTCLAAPVDGFALANPSGAPLRTLRGGQASGPLVGGNLSLLCALIGTRWLPPLKGAVLVIEDVGESPYSVDRLLAQLALAGCLDQIGGLVVGDFGECFPPANPDPGPPLDELVMDWVGDRPLPVISGLEYGHIRQRCTVPLGAWCHLDADAGCIRIAGPARASEIV